MLLRYVVARVCSLQMAYWQCFLIGKGETKGKQQLSLAKVMEEVANEILIPIYEKQVLVSRRSSL